MDVPLDDGDLAGIVDEYFSRSNVGDRLDMEAFADRYPQYSIELRTLLPVVAAIRSAGQTRGQIEDPPLQINGYRLIKEIARGGMGIVFEAVHEQMDRLVALKLFSPTSTYDSARFDREIRSLARLQHPHIVIAYDAGTSGIYRFLAMELLVGSDTCTLIESHGPLPLDRAIEVIRQAAEGLAHAHSLGIVHRDVKPSNLFATIDGTVKILDLGLACPIPSMRRTSSPDGELTTSRHLIGTLDYIAPEQVRDPKKVNEACDIYSLGCTFFFLLTGRRLFHRTSFDEVLRPDQALLDDCLQGVASEFGERISQIIQRMTAQTVAARPNSMSTVIDELTQLQTLIGGSSPELDTKTFSGDKSVIENRAVGVVASGRYRQIAWGAFLIFCTTAIAILLAWLPTHRELNHHPILSNTVRPVEVISANSEKRGASSVDTDFALVPAADFQMGLSDVAFERLTKSSPGQANVLMLHAEMPQHSVSISESFFMCTHEVTVGEFRRFIQETGYRPRCDERKIGMGWDALTGNSSLDDRFSWDRPGWPQNDDHPVVNVTWTDAVKYCEWKTRTNSVTYRLPTEAEWEYACGPDAALRYQTTERSKLANVADLSLRFVSSRLSTEEWNDGFAFTAPVQSFAPNRYGLYDMIGNVWEWCSDWYGPYDDSGLIDPRGPPGGTLRIVRGGAWNSNFLDARPTSRVGRAKTADFTYGIGFRVLREMPEN